jgi:hypothetical protein
MMLYMLSQHRAVGLQTDCMVVVPAPVVRLPDSHVYALWPWATGCHPCNIFNHMKACKAVGTIVVPWWPERKWWPLLRARNGASWAPYVVVDRCLDVDRQADVFLPGPGSANMIVVGEPKCLPCVWTSRKSSEHDQDYDLFKLIVM